jgi:hypothetical protein
MSAHLATSVWTCYTLIISYKLTAETPHAEVYVNIPIADNRHVTPKLMASGRHVISRHAPETYLKSRQSFGCSCGSRSALPYLQVPATEPYCVHESSPHITIHCFKIHTDDGASCLYRQGFWILSGKCPVRIRVRGSMVRFPMRSLDFSVDLIAPAALWPCDRLSL